VAFCENCAHWVGRINDKHEGSLFGDERSHVLEVNLEVLFFIQPVLNSFSAESWTKVMIEWIPNLRHKHLIALIGKSHKQRKQTHIDSMVDMHITDVKWHISIVQLHHSLPERWSSSRRNITMIAFLFDTLFHQFVTYH